jgi:hypothetical protein
MNRYLDIPSYYKQCFNEQSDVYVYMESEWIRQWALGLYLALYYRSYTLNQVI